MPIYEYRCHSCNKVSSVFTRTISALVEPECGHCRGRDLQRRMSSFAMGKTVRSVHRDYPMGPGAPPPGYYSDPRNIGRYVEEGFARHGLEMPESVRQTIAAAREGDLPKGQEE
jgi:putative FmdB family regulatory protein